MIGAIVGALFGGHLVDRIGRYKMFMADMVLFVGAAIACALAWNAESLIAFRFLMGLGIGLDFPVALAFLAEYSARKGKGGRVTLWQPMWYAATAASFAVLLPLYFLIPESDHANLWRWAVGFGAIPALVVLVVRRRYMNESASWAANQGDLAGAVRILQESYGANAELAPESELEYPPTQPKATLAGFKALFSIKYRRRTILSGVVGACQSMQYYAVGFYLPFIVGVFLSLDRLSTITIPLVFNIRFRGHRRLPRRCPRPQTRIMELVASRVRHVSGRIDRARVHWGALLKHGRISRRLATRFIRLLSQRWPRRAGDDNGDNELPHVVARHWRRIRTSSPARGIDRFPPSLPGPCRADGNPGLLDCRPRTCCCHSHPIDHPMGPDEGRCGRRGLPRCRTGQPDFRAFR